MTETIDEFFRIQYYRSNMKLVQFSGVWPYQSTFTKSIRSFVMFIMAEAILIPEILGLIKVTRINPINILECLPTMVIAIGCGMKLINLVCNNEKMKMLLTRVITDWSSITAEKEVQMLRLYSERAREYTMGYTCWMVCSFITFGSLPILRILDQNPETNNSNYTSIIPLQVDYLVDTREYYYPILIHCYATLISHAIILIGADTIFIGFVQHTCGMFSILSYRLEHMTDIENQDADCDATKDAIQRRIIHCIRCHQELLDTVDLFQSIYTVYFFLQLGINMINMSISGVQTMRNIDVPVEFIRHFAATLAQLVHLFFECWQAQQIIDHSVKLYESIGKSAWYRTSEKSKKLIAVMLMRSAVTCKLSAGGMIILCFESFTAVVSKSMSYFTVLRTLQ